MKTWNEIEKEIPTITPKRYGIHKPTINVLNEICERIQYEMDRKMGCTIPKELALEMWECAYDINGEMGFDLTIESLDAIKKLISFCWKLDRGEKCQEQK